MIKVITGIPGSGKSYYAVNEIVYRFYKYDNFTDTFSLTSDVLIFSNIDNLKLQHLSLDFYLKEHNISLETFFTVEYQSKLVQKYKKVVYFLDEAQKYFHNKYFNKDVFYLFQYHRHLQIDFYLLTPDIFALSRNITSLAEYYIKSLPTTYRVFGQFRYRFISGNDVLRTKMIRTDKKIFSLYASYQNEDGFSQKSFSPYRKYVFIFLGLGLFAFFSFHLFINSFFPSQARLKSSHVRRVAASEPARTRRRTRARKLTRMQLQSSKSNFAKIPQQKYVLVNVGYMSDGRNISYITFNGHIISFDQFPYRLLINRSIKTKRIRSVYAYVPQSIYKNILSAEQFAASVKPLASSSSLPQHSFSSK